MFLTTIGLVLIGIAIIPIFAKWARSDREPWLSYSRPWALVLLLTFIGVCYFVGYLMYEVGVESGKGDYCFG